MNSKLTYFLSCLIFTQISGLEELKFVQIITGNTYLAPELFFREGLNGDAKDLKSTNEFDYKKLSIGTKDMPNNLKMDIFNFGLYLRSKYGSFLGDIFMENEWKIRTMGVSVSMMSGLLINAAVWPPVPIQKWHNDLDWQPIPTDYVEIKWDKLLFGTLCPDFQKELDFVTKRESLEQISPIYKHLVDFIGNRSDIVISKPMDVATLYHVFQSMENSRYRLPEWAQDIYPDGSMKNVTLMSYKLLSTSSKQKHLNGGTFLSDLMSNFADHYNGTNDPLKMIVYTGDVRNILGILHNLDLNDSQHIPHWSAALIFEFYKDNTTDEYTVQLKYYTGRDNEEITLEIPKCGETCNVNKFKQHIEDVIPKDEESLCPVITDDQKSSGSTSRETKILTFVLLSMIIVKNYN